MYYIIYWAMWCDYLSGKKNKNRQPVLAYWSLATFSLTLAHDMDATLNTQSYLPKDKKNYQNVK